MITRHAWAGVAASCVTIAACNYSPSAQSFRTENFAVRVGETAEKTNGALVTRAFFREARVRPLFGRLFLDEEYQVPGTCSVVIAAQLWQRRFGGDPRLIGKTLGVNQETCTIVGILPAKFQFPKGAEIWMPQNR